MSSNTRFPFKTYLTQSLLQQEKKMELKHYKKFEVEESQFCLHGAGAKLLQQNSGRVFCTFIRQRYIATKSI